MGTNILRLKCVHARSLEPRIFSISRKLTNFSLTVYMSFSLSIFVSISLSFDYPLFLSLDLLPTQEVSLSLSVSLSPSLFTHSFCMKYLRIHKIGITRLCSTSHSVLHRQTRCYFLSLSPSSLGHRDISFST